MSIQYLARPGESLLRQYLVVGAFFARIFMCLVWSMLRQGFYFGESAEGMRIYITRSLGALRAPTSSWRPFGPLDFVHRALRALRPCDPRPSDLIALDSVLALG